MAHNGSALDNAFTVFIALNILFLMGTAIWFRLVHAAKKNRSTFTGGRDELISEIQWLYSLRSNLLLFIVTLSTYLLYIGELLPLLVMFSVGSLINIATDTFYVYNVKLFPIARIGHRMAGLVIIVATVIYMIIHH